MRYVIILTVLFAAGCTKPGHIVHNYDQNKGFYIPAGTIIDWRCVPYDKLPNDLKRYESDVTELFAKAGRNEPNAIVLKTREIKYDGLFICKEHVAAIFDSMVEEDLAPSWIEKKLRGLFGGR